MEEEKSEKETETKEESSEEKEEALQEDKKQENSGDEKSKSQSKETLTDKFRQNPWVLSTLVLGVLALILIAGSFGMTGSTISEGVVSADDAGQSILDFAKSKGVPNPELIDVEDTGSFYMVTISIDGQNLPLYVTKDGKFFAQALTPLTADNSGTPQETPASTDVPKSDKPIVELFVMSYCPYGTQAEKGILPVVALLKDKIDFKLRFVHYILHGEPEDTENKRELCIREEQGQDILNKYMVCILNSDNPQVPGDVSACEKEAGVNSAKLKNCMSTKADEYFADDSALSEGYGVRGSPTLIINGAQSSAGRSPASYLAGICSAFNEAPEECNEQLSSAGPSAGFGYNEGSDTVAQC